MAEESGLEISLKAEDVAKDERLAVVAQAASVLLGQLQSAAREFMEDDAYLLEAPLEPILSPEDAAREVEAGNALRRRQDRIENRYAPLKAGAHGLHSMICAAEKQFLAPTIAKKKARAERYSAWVEEEEAKAIREKQERAKQELDANLAAAVALDEAAREARESGADVRAAGLETKAAAALEQAELSEEAVHSPVPAAAPKNDGAATRAVPDWSWANPDRLNPEYRCNTTECPDVKKRINAAVRQFKKLAERAVGFGAIRVFERKATSFTKKEL